MATPFDLDLIKAGIDEVIKVQAEKGDIRLGRLAPTIDHKEGYYTAQRITGFKDARIYSRGESIEPDRKEMVSRKDYLPYLFAKSWITYQYDKDEDVYNEMASNIADAAIAMLRRKDKEEMNLLNNGFDTNFTGPDGLPLFSTAHTGAAGVAVRANRAAAGSSLDVALLEAMLSGYNDQKDFNGESLYTNGNVNVWTGNTLWPLLWRICEAEYQATTPDNDPNFIGTRVKPMLGHQLSSTSAVYMVAANPDDHFLRTIQFSPYQVGLPVEGHALDTKHTVFERYRSIFESFEYTYGDPGA